MSPFVWPRPAILEQYHSFTNGSSTTFLISRQGLFSARNFGVNAGADSFHKQIAPGNLENSSALDY